MVDISMEDIFRVHNIEEVLSGKADSIDDDVLKVFAGTPLDCIHKEFPHFVYKPC